MFKGIGKFYRFKMPRHCKFCGGKKPKRPAEPTPPKVPVVNLDLCNTDLMGKKTLMFEIPNFDGRPCLECAKCKSGLASSPCTTSKAVKVNTDHGKVEVYMDDCLIFAGDPFGIQLQMAFQAAMQAPQTSDPNTPLL